MERDILPLLEQCMVASKGNLIDGSFSSRLVQACDLPQNYSRADRVLMWMSPGLRGIRQALREPKEIEKHYGTDSFHLFHYPIYTKRLGENVRSIIQGEDSFQEHMAHFQLKLGRAQLITEKKRRKSLDLISLNRTEQERKRFLKQFRRYSGEFPCCIRVDTYTLMVVVGDRRQTEAIVRTIQKDPSQFQRFRSRYVPHSVRREEDVIERKKMHLYDLINEPLVSVLELEHNE